MFTRKVIWKVLLLFVIASMLFSACAPAAAPTTAPTTAPVVAPTTAPVVAPTTAPVVAPTTAPVVVPTKAAAKTFKVAFVGAMVHPYYNPIPGALKDAERDFNTGPIEWQMPQKFDQNVQNVLIDGLVAKGYNLIGFQVADPVAGNVEMKKVVDQGIPVVTFAGCPETPSPSTFCLATDTGQSAYIATTNLIKLMGGKGNIVHLSGFIAETNTKKRMDGVQKAVDENPGVKLIQTITDIDTAETAQNAVSSLLAAKRSEINGIVATAYNPSVAVANELRSLDEKNIKSVLIDSDQIVLDAIKDGYVSGTMSQNPYGQAYLGVYSLYLMSQGYTWKADAPWFIDSGTFLINQANLATVEKDMAKLTSDMVKTWKDKYFDAPK